MDCFTCCRPHLTFPQAGFHDIARPAVAVLVYIDKKNAVFGQRRATKDCGKMKYWHSPRAKFKISSVCD